MKIRFGLQLDGQRGWHGRNVLNEITVGTNGMLGILEPQLGLLTEAVPQSRRVVQYLECLKQYNHPGRFYHRSLEADELGTAATLLGWRDQWHLHGWNKEVGATAASRLRDLAEVERATVGKVAPSEGERLAAILAVMQRRIPAITRITLTDPLMSFPKRWQQVLSGLPIEFVSIKPQPEAGLLLHVLQDRLQRVQAGETFRDDEKIDFRQDNSVVILRAETRLLAARWVAELMESELNDAVLVVSDSASLLDDVMVAAGCPRQGLGESSAYRPALQLLPMSLALLWAPLDFNVLISFLSHPISPVRSFARRQLAGKLASKPGIGGAEWEAVLTKIDTHYGQEASIVREQIKTWIDHPRFDQQQGVPVEKVLSRAQKLKEYFGVRLGDKDDTKRASWQAGYSQTSAFISSLVELQKTEIVLIRPRQLQKLLMQATARGTGNPRHVAEVGAIAVANDPAAVVENFETVIWWQPVMPVIPKPYPWSISELVSLENSGVELPDVAEKLENLAAVWLKPVFAAKNQLVIVLPPNEVEVHPVWQMISTLVSNICEHSIEHVFSGAGQVVGEQVVVPHTPLPQRKRWWHLPKGTPIPRRQYDSFSSLELFLFNPYQWLLKYPAGLKASNILSVSDGFLLHGQLAHNLVERFFALPDALNIPENGVLEWFDEVFPQIVETDGAVLLMHGRRSDYEELRYRLRRALTTLIAQLHAAGITKVQSEFEMNGPYPGGQILGYADLVLTNADGKHAIVDMKWGGTKKYYEKLKDNTHLQLGIYAELMRQRTGAWPEVAYFILAEGKLFAQHDNYFPDGLTVNKKIDEFTPHLWERFKKSYEWRNELLSKLQIEVVQEGIEETDESIAPEDGLQPEVMNPNYNEFLHLAGWSKA